MLFRSRWLSQTRAFLIKQSQEPNLNETCHKPHFWKNFRSGSYLLSCLQTNPYPNPNSYSNIHRAKAGGGAGGHPPSFNPTFVATMYYFTESLRKTGNTSLILDTLILFQRTFKSKALRFQTNLISKFSVYVVEDTFLRR